MKIHQRIHSGEKPYQCKYSDCGKWFTQMANLKIHHQKHEDPTYHEKRKRLMLMKSMEGSELASIKKIEIKAKKAAKDA